MSALDKVIAFAFITILVTAMVLFLERRRK